jgi:general secretion pathway protein G
LKARKTTPWHRVRLSFILTLLLLFSLVMFGAHRMYDTDVFAAREAVLKFDLQQIRNAIDQYKSDQNHAPNSLHDLVDAQYLKEIPSIPSLANKTGCSFALPARSARISPFLELSTSSPISTHRALDGTPYNTW